MSSLEQSIRKNLRRNVLANLGDGAGFGFGWGFGSIGTIIPLFVSRLTTSALLIGLIPSIHAVGWQLPQLFLANSVARLRRYKPMVLLMTIHERVPFLGLALVALSVNVLGVKWALALTFVMLVWQGLGAGFTANAWQSMIAKIIPPESRGTFFGAQASLSNILMSVAAIAAGYILVRVRAPFNFSLCFFLTIVGMGFSYFSLSVTREPADEEKVIPESLPSPWKGGLEILRRDRNFSAFLAIRVLWQFATMGSAFYIVFGLRQFSMSELTAGFLTAALTIASTIASTLMGWLGDKLGHRTMLIVGALSATLSAVMAWQAPSVGWLYPAFILSGLAGTAYWTTGMAITVEFGSEAERPTYIGLSNTLVAPFSIIAPLVGGLIAQGASFQVTFIVCVAVGLVVTALLFLFVRDPRPRKAPALEGESEPALPVS